MLTCLESQMMNAYIINISNFSWFLLLFGASCNSGNLMFSSTHMDSACNLASQDQAQSGQWRCHGHCHDLNAPEQHVSNQFWRPANITGHGVTRRDP